MTSRNEIWVSVIDPVSRTEWITSVPVSVGVWQGVTERAERKGALDAHDVLSLLMEAVSCELRSVDRPVQS